MLLSLWCKGTKWQPHCEVQPRAHPASELTEDWMQPEMANIEGQARPGQGWVSPGDQIHYPPPQSRHCLKPNMPDCYFHRSSGLCELHLLSQRRGYTWRAQVTTEDCGRLCVCRRGWRLPPNWAFPPALGPSAEVGLFCSPAVSIPTTYCTPG